MNLSYHLLVILIRTIFLVGSSETSLSLAIEPSSTTTSSSSSTRTGTKQLALQRSVKKASNKLFEFGSTTYPNGILVVDGNNVRGIAKFQWSPVELSCRIALFCQTYNIPRHVIVWDHGHSRFAALNSPTSVTLFSGLSQRADDILVQEAWHLVQLFNRLENDADEFGPDNLCFVTNDAELQSRLRNVNYVLEEEGERSRRRNTPTHIGVMKHKTLPLLMDSTRFVELLSSVNISSFLSGNNDVSRTKELLRAVDKAQESLQNFAKLQKTRYNPRREKTWERCILAEVLRRAYCERSSTQQEAIIDDVDQRLETNVSSTELSSFGARYLQDLESRGFETPSLFSQSSIDGLGPPNNNLTGKNDGGNILGPLRLDKRQKRLLQKYNSALQKGILLSNVTNR